MSHETLILAVFSCTGLWTLINFIVQRHFANKDRKQDDLKLIKEALLASLQDRLLYLCDAYIETGSIELNQLQSLRRMYKAYKGLGGNEFITDLVENKVNHLPIAH
ncbi:MAG: hypothetical protein IJH98_08555 [Solobacterium sp.]|nr:hypothetical protein [Solobacterium sp.]